MIQIKIADSDEVLKKIYQFRYQVYCNELGKNHIKYNSIEHTLEEEEDKTGIIIYMEDDSGMIGTLRANISLLKDTDMKMLNHFNLINLAYILPDEKICIVSRLMVRKDYRGKSVGAQLMFFISKLGIEENVSLAFIEVAPDVVGQYSRFGFRQYDSIKNLQNESIYDFRIKMMLVVHDNNYLESIGTPFISLLKKKDVKSSELQNILKEAFPKFDSEGLNALKPIAGCIDFKNKLSCLMKYGLLISLFTGDVLRKNKEYSHYLILTPNHNDNNGIMNIHSFDEDLIVNSNCKIVLFKPCYMEKYCRKNAA